MTFLSEHYVKYHNFTQFPGGERYCFTLFARKADGALHITI